MELLTTYNILSKGPKSGFRNFELKITLCTKDSLNQKHIHKKKNPYTTTRVTLDHRHLVHFENLVVRKKNLKQVDGY